MPAADPSDPIHLLCAADARYGGYAGIMLASVLHANPSEIFDIHLLSDRMRAGDRHKLATLVQRAVSGGQELRGWQVDRAAASVLKSAGFGDAILHRTGHSLGESVHGNGVHMDDYETHDDRRILPGTGFTVEPGLYFDTFGVRTEINVFRRDRDAVVSGPRQMALVTLGT